MNSSTSSDAKEELHPYQAEAQRIFSSLPQQPWHHPHSSPSPAARNLAASTSAAKLPIGDQGTYIWSTIVAIHVCATAHPSALDAMLLTYHSATKLFAETIENDYGHGPDAGIRQLRWWLVDCSNGFQGVLFPQNIGTEDPTDKSNLNFKVADMRENLAKVLDEVELWKRERTAWIIAAAMQARCLALDIVCVNEGSHIESRIDDGYRFGDRRWSKSDFIGGCVMLRGCAKSLLDLLAKRGKMDKKNIWKSGLEDSLLLDSPPSRNDLIMKHHAAVRPSHD